MDEIDVKKYVIKLMETRREAYLTEPIRILEDYRKEKEKIDEYNGRQLLELLQNADDAAESASEKKCFICLKDNKLIVANNGEKFSAKGIESLMYSNLSPKMKTQNKIGQKGLGFRSVLSWADKVTIKSYDFAVEFSKNIALEFLNEIIRENADIATILKDRSSDDESDTIAILRCPKIIDVPTEYSDYDTYIVIKLKDDQVENVQKQIDEEIDKEMLLFLNNLETVIVESPKRNFILKKCISTDSICISEKNNNEHSDEKIWHLCTQKGEKYGKNYELKIAWSDALDDSKNKLYSYFKTNVSFPFPALIHGTFELTSDRNHLLPESMFNNGLKEILKDFIIGIASQIAKGKVSYDPLKLLNIKDNEFITRDEIFAKIKESDAKVFPAIDGNYISFKAGPFYLEHDYASIINDSNASNFSNLLQHTSEDSIVELLRDYCVVKLPDEDFITKLAQMSHDQKSRARIIYWLSQEEFGETPPISLPQVLIDGSGHTATIDDDLFLPPLTQSLEIPKSFSIKILNAQLYNELQDLYNCKNKADVMAEKLSAFGIKPYRFVDIIRSILAKENAKQSSSKHQYNSDLLERLYELYTLNEDSKFDPNAPNTPSIYIMNRRKEVVKTTDVYLGKEYGNMLCENLYKYDESKFVASPQKLGFKGANDNGFLIWIGIADKPRFVDIEINDSNEKSNYGDFILKHFPYETQYIYDHDRSIVSFEKLKGSGYEIENIKATSIDDLDNILLNSNLETIIAWFSVDNRISNKGEPHDESKMTIYISGKKYYAHVNSHDMPSYLRWKLRNSEWMVTVNDQKARPDDCCLSKAKEISALINTPKIDYESVLLKGENFTRRNIDRILIDIGVKQEVCELPTKILYLALNKLSENDFDPDGKKARLLYRELIENFEKDSIDPNTPERIDFVQNGKVLCKTANGYSFQPVCDAYYVQDRIYGDNIINQFNTIAIDKRRNVNVIENLFGVKPLAELQFAIKSHTEANETLNMTLKEELVKLNPYIYALRSAKENELSRLKELWKVIVCSQIEPEYKKQGNSSSKSFELNDYEFVYAQEQNTYYILVKNCNRMTFSDLKSDFKFADVIAEIYSNILKVDSIRPTLSRLFKSDQKERDYLLDREVDNSHNVLQEAFKALNVVNDQKVLFWLRILELKKTPAPFREYDQNELAKLVYENIQINTEDFSISYDDLSSSDCRVAEMKRLFTSLNISIEQFNEGSNLSINLIPYYEKRIFDLKAEYENRFEGLLYKHWIGKTNTEKIEYLNTIQQYKGFKEFGIQNSLSVNLESILKQSILSQFGIDISESPYETDISSLYNSNLTKLMSKFKEVDHADLRAFINDKDDIRSLVCFGEFDTIIKRFKESRTTSKPNKEIHVNGTNITGNDFEELYQCLNEHDMTATISNIQTEGLPVVSSGSTGPKHGNGNRKPMSERRKKDIGFVGEVVVFTTLKKQHVQSLSWDSEYAKEAGVNLKGDEMNHYDLKFKKDDEYHFVEVKSTTSDNLEFEISEPEFEFAMSQGNKYEIYIVTNVEDEKRKINNIGNPFIFEEGESLTHCQRFTVLNDRFIIKMKERE